MHGIFRTLAALAALTVMSGCASAPPVDEATAAPRLGGASMTYDSPWSGYQAFNPSEPLLDWRAVNDAVREAGGHLGLMRSSKPVGEPAKPGGDRGGHGAHAPAAGKEAPK